MSTDTIIIHQDNETASALPVRRVPMTLAVHADNPIPITIPEHRRRTTPATRTAWPAPVDDRPCGCCGASAMMSRRYYFRGAPPLSELRLEEQPPDPALPRPRQTRRPATRPRQPYDAGAQSRGRIEN